VIAAVHGYCLGGGIGIAGNADIFVAAYDATFGLPEVDRGALGAATHLSRLVPQHKMRAMVYTSATATAAEHPPYDLWVECAAAPGDAADRVDEALDIAHPLFEQVADSLGALPDQVERVLLLVVLRKHQDTGVGPLSS